VLFKPSNNSHSLITSLILICIVNIVLRRFAICWFIKICRRFTEISTVLPNNNNIIIITASHEDEMNDKYNDKLCTSNEVIQ